MMSEKYILCNASYHSLPKLVSPKLYGSFFNNETQPSPHCNAPRGQKQVVFGRQQNRGRGGGVGGYWMGNWRVIGGLPHFRLRGWVRPLSLIPIAGTYLAISRPSLPVFQALQLMEPCWKLHPMNADNC